MKIEKVKIKLKEIKDPRRLWGNLRHELWEILVIALCSTICLGEDYDVKDCIVTIDAGGCQKAITEKIIAEEADYVLTLKKNHRIFHEKVESHFASLDLDELASSHRR